MISEFFLPGHCVLYCFLLPCLQCPWGDVLLMYRLYLSCLMQNFHSLSLLLPYIYI